MDNSLKLPITILLIIAALSSVDVRAVILKYRVTDEDKTEIIKQMLEPQLVGEKVDETDKIVSDFELMMRAKGGIVLSTENVKARLVPAIAGVRLQLLSPREIQRKANREGDFMYLAFPQFEVKGSKVVVTLVRTWAKSKDSAMGYLSGGSETYEFSKESGKWVSKFIKGYIS